MPSKDHSKSEPLEVFFDESGFTGARLLDPAQPIFSYASVAISNDEAFDILRRARERNPVQMPELKANKLLGSPRGVALVTDVLDAIEGRYSVIVQDKLVILCGKVFEYLFEPVFQQDPSLLYRKNLHKFVAMYCFICFQGPAGQEAIRQFERFMRTLDPTEAPVLFDPARLEDLDDQDPFKMVIKFAQGYRDIIVSDNQRMRTDSEDRGKWVLDVSIAGLWSLLNHWGATGRPLRVTCDDSKPLMAQVEHITGGDDDPGIRRVREMGGSAEGYGWVLDRPIVFGDSRNHPALQVADLIAGAASRVVNQDPTASDQALRESLQRHVHKHSIMPDFDHVRLGTREVDVNWLVLMELGERASRGDDPYAGLAEFYWAAERTWMPERLGED